MEVCKIVINSLEDAKAGKKIMESATENNINECVDWTIGILEKGTNGGQTSLMFILKDAQGEHHIAQMTANQFEMLISAFRGADQRFKGI